MTRKCIANAQINIDNGCLIVLISEKKRHFENTVNLFWYPAYLGDRENELPDSVNESIDILSNFTVIE